MIMATEKYLSISESAKLLGVTTRRVNAMCLHEQFPGAYKDGRSWKIPSEAVADVVQKNHLRTENSADILPLAVGKTSFREVVSTSYYVDKTLFIKDLIDSNDEVTLCLRPRRFGKTLTMSMLQTFFEESDEDTSVYFQDKNIWLCGEKYRRQQGKYPVVFLTFKDIKYPTFRDSLEAIQELVIREFERHPELEKSDLLSRADRRYLMQLEEASLTESNLSWALGSLTSMLSAVHHMPAVILIDEYDTPIQHAYTQGYYDEMISFMRRFLSYGLKDNTSLAFGVLTGILRISKENLLSGLNNLTVNSALDEKYSEYFGFTANEVEEMADYYGKTDKLEEIRQWYDGYLFGRTQIYNPWSVTSYLNNHCTPRAYWSNSGDNSVIRDIVSRADAETAETLSSLLQEETVRAYINVESVYPQIAENPGFALSYLLLTGYLTVAEQAQETDIGTIASLKLPNSEVRRVYKTEVVGWIREQISPGITREIEKALLDNDPVRLQSSLRNYMLTCISSFDTSAEGFYHGMMLGIVANFSDAYYIRSNRESGEGRFDLQLEPRTTDRAGIIMEFKYLRAEDKSDLKKLAVEALEQIDARQYDADMISRGVTNIEKFGIAFRGKQAEIVSA